MKKKSNLKSLDQFVGEYVKDVRMSTLQRIVEVGLGGKLKIIIML